MEFLKCRDVRWKGPKKRNKPDVLATTAKHPDERSQISHYGWMQPTYMRSVSFWGKFTSGSRISASRSDLLKVPTIRRVEALKEESGGTMQIQFSLRFHLWLRLFSSAGCGSCFYWTSLGECSIPTAKVFPWLSFWVLASIRFWFADLASIVFQNN